MQIFYKSPASIGLLTSLRGACIAGETTDAWLGVIDEESTGFWVLGVFIDGEIVEGCGDWLNPKDTYICIYICMHIYVCQ
jgi:hypothetical protein